MSFFYEIYIIWRVETERHHVAQTRLKLAVILLPQPPKC